MRLALKSLVMAKNEILSHAKKDVEISMSASAKLFITFSFLSFLKFLGGSLKGTFNLGGLKCMAEVGGANDSCR